MVRRVDMDAALEELRDDGVMPVAGSCMQECALKHGAAVEMVRVSVQICLDIFELAGSCTGTPEAQTKS